MERNFVGILRLFDLLGRCFRANVMTDKVVDLFEEKQKRASIFSLEQASADVAAYETVVNKSVEDFHTYSVSQKQELYSSLAAFNIKIINQLLERKRDGK